MISLENVSKSFGQNEVFKSLSFNWPDNSAICLMGRSGPGKTTVAKILLGLLAPDSGSVWGLDGAVCSAVFQESRLLLAFDSLTNLSLVNGAAASHEIAALLGELGLPGESFSLPVGKLSGGMRRRVAIARALIFPATHIIADEPFKGLDSETKQTVMATVKRHTQNKKALLLITHNAAEAEYFGTEIIEMGGGQGKYYEL